MHYTCIHGNKRSTFIITFKDYPSTTWCTVQGCFDKLFWKNSMVCFNLQFTLAQQACSAMAAAVLTEPNQASLCTPAPSLMSPHLCFFHQPQCTSCFSTQPYTMPSSSHLCLTVFPVPKGNVIYNKHHSCIQYLLKDFTK